MKIPSKSSSLSLFPETRETTEVQSNYKLKADTPYGISEQYLMSKSK